MKKPDSMNPSTGRRPIWASRTMRMNTFDDPPGFVLLALIGCITAWGNLSAQTPGDTAVTAPWYASISVNGFLSTAYVFNFNRPDVLRNQFRVFDFADNSIKVDVMELSLKKEAGKSGEAGFRVDLTAGSSVPRISRSS